MTALRLRRQPTSYGGTAAMIVLVVIIGSFLLLPPFRDFPMFSLELSSLSETETNDETPTKTTTVAAPSELGLSELMLQPKKSKHPKWKLWHEMGEQEQAAAMERVGEYLTKYGNLITKNGKRMRGRVDHGTCERVEIGLKGNHQLCGPKPKPGEPCTFLSLGINDDPSFDKDLGENWGCRGFAGDPTVDYSSKLHPRVTFHNIGASMLSDNEEREINKGGTEEWWTTSMPKLKDFLGLEHINILKMDCEGCEMAFPRDILAEDPRFLFHVDQISLETHVTKTWIKTTEEAYYFGLNFALLEEAGFEMEWSNICGCSKRHEVTGCVPELEKYKYPCGHDDWPGRPNAVIGRSCQDFLWKRHPEKADKSILIQ